MKNIKYITYYLITFIVWLLFIFGLYELWMQNSMNLFMNYIFTAFGIVGLLYFQMLFHEKFIEQN